MVTTITKVWKGLNLFQMLREIDYWFWFLMSACLVASWSIVQTSQATTDAVKGLQTLQAQQHTFTAPSQPASDAYLTLKGVALGSKYKERGVKREDLDAMLEGLLKEGKINLLYKQSILAGYDRGLTAK